jgi:hypothetical protein
MGADIHPYLEIKVNGKWELVGGLTESRNYSVFSLLAGVRGDDAPIFSQADYLPNDVSVELEKYYESWIDDAHSLTVINYEDLFLIDKAVAEEQAILMNSFVGKWMKIIEKCMVFAEDARVVMWFDN